MAKLGINTGIVPDDGTGDSLLDGAVKINSNFDDIYTYFGDGTNLTFTGGVSSQWVTTGVGIHTLSNVGIGTTNPTSKLTVTGDGTFTGVVTATTFVGALTGTATTATNAQGLTGTPNIAVGTIDGSSIKMTGISTLGTVQISSGIVTASSGIVTYYGDTSNAIDGRWTLGANGTSDYTFTGIGFTQTTNDPVLYLARGRVYEFVNNSGGSHPFEIRANNGGVAYGEGVTNNAAASGTIRFEIPFNSPNTLYYQCTSHSGMGNTISVYPSTI